MMPEDGADRCSAGGYMQPLSFVLRRRNAMTGHDTTSYNKGGMKQMQLLHWVITPLFLCLFVAMPSFLLAVWPAGNCRGLACILLSGEAERDSTSCIPSYPT